MQRLFLQTVGVSNLTLNDGGHDEVGGDKPPVSTSFRQRLTYLFPITKLDYLSSRGRRGRRQISTWSDGGLNA